MNDADRFRLLHGPYAAPRCRVGKRLVCEARGAVAVCGMSAGRIPWPVGKRGRAKALVVFGDLARAVRTESNQAVCHWWGVTPQTVSGWRRLLGVPRATEGTTRLYRDYTPERLPRHVQERALAKANSPEANAKKGAAWKGKPRPPHVKKLLDRSGSKHTAEARAKMREAQRPRREKTMRGQNSVMDAGPRSG